MEQINELSKRKSENKISIWNNVKRLFVICWKADRKYIYRCILGAASDVALSFSISAAVALLVATANQPENMNASLLQFLLLFIIYYLARTGSQILKNQIYTDGTNFRMPLMEEMLGTLTEMDYQEMDTAVHRTKFNEIIEILDGGDNSTVQSFLPTIARFCTNLLGIFLYGTVIGSLHPLLILIIFIFGVANYIYALKTNRIEKDVQEQLSPYSRKISYMTDRTGDFRAVKDVRLYHMEKWFTNRFQNLYEEMFQIKSRIYRRKFNASALAAFLSVFRDGIAYFLLIDMIMKGSISAASFALFFTMVTTLSVWLDGFLTTLSDFQRIGVQLKPYMEVIDRKDSINSVKFEKILNLKEKYFNLPLSIEFENVSFTYPEQSNPTIDRLNLKIAPGEKVGIVGNNGAGKTTLIKLLCGLYRPNSGRILVNNQEIHQLSTKQQASLFSTVFQDYYELPYSIEETVRRGQPEKNISYQQAMAKSGMDQECRKFPLGDQTKLVRQVNLHAVDLSGGQKQKLQLARALYKDGPILVLDEPTASLDPIAENEIYQQYDRMTTGKTSIFISHRLSSTHFCDRIIFIENGSVKESGSHRQLMEKRGKYWKMYQIQSQYYQEDYQSKGGTAFEFMDGEIKA